MKSVLISIQPKWCELIANRKKTIEVRKSRPNIEKPFKCYIYCTNYRKIVLDSDTDHNFFIDKNCGGEHYYNGKVIGEFVCDWITEITPMCDIDGCVNQYIHGYPAILGENDCLSFNDMKVYLGNKKGYDWHISDLKIYDKPKELGEFRKPCSSAPTARCYPENCERCPWNTVVRPPQSWCYIEEQEKTMTKKEQIEEMAKIVDEMYNVYTTTAEDIAEGLYNAGYRKIDDDCAVITKAELKQYKAQAVKEFAEKLKELLHDDYIMPSGITDERCVFEGIDELLKECEK